MQQVWLALRRRKQPWPKRPATKQQERETLTTVAATRGCHLMRLNGGGGGEGVGVPGGSARSGSRVVTASHTAPATSSAPAVPSTTAHRTGSAAASAW